MSSFDWVVPRDLPSLAGHFPGRPIVPGVAVLDQLLLHLTSARVVKINTAKFSSPALPGECLHFALETKTNGALSFRVSCGEREVASGTLGVAAS